MRLFVAIELDPALRGALTDLQDALRRDGAQGNYTPAENLHLTLAFIGEVPEAEPALEALQRVDFAPFPLRLAGVGCFGDLFWAGLEQSEALAAVVRRLRRALAEAGVPFERKRFSPHVTLLRRASFRRPPEASPAPEEMTVTRLSLMRSDRGKRGMIYTAIGSVEAGEKE